MMFKGVNVWTRKMFAQEGMEMPKGAIPIDGDFYLDPKTTFAQLTKAIDLDEEGSYDFAIPQRWAEDNSWPKAIWFYPHSGESSVFGRPMFLSEMIDRFRQKFTACRDEVFEKWLEEREGE